VGKATWAALAACGMVIGLVAAPSSAAADPPADRLGPFESIVVTAFVDTNEIGVEFMFMDCDWIQRVVRPDGSWTETQQCELTEPAPFFPGTPPDRALTYDEIPCHWFSDYALNTTGDNLSAESARIRITPSGQVHVTSMYSADPLTKDECDLAEF
jgi:hypothetical protein